MRSRGKEVGIPMKRKKITLHQECVPSLFHPLIQNSAIYDSSCSPAARVYFIDKEDGYYLKTASKGSLLKEASLTRFFHSKQLAAEVLAYESLDQDWLLTARVAGEDCTAPMYLEAPIRLCDTTAELLRTLHSTSFEGCPVSNHTSQYLATAQRNYVAQAYDLQLFPDNWGYAAPEDAWRVIEENGKYLRCDTLLHGDYCLPNIMLNDWLFSGFIDLDSAGVGDRHVDLFWGTWSLFFNLKTDRYYNRFLDAYGRNDINEELLRVIAAIEVFG